MIILLKLLYARIASIIIIVCALIATIFLYYYCVCVKLQFLGSTAGQSTRHQIVSFIYLFILLCQKGHVFIFILLFSLLLGQKDHNYLTIIVP
jgi:hypothetical protein